MKSGNLFHFMYCLICQAAYFTGSNFTWKNIFLAILLGYLSLKMNPFNNSLTDKHTFVLYMCHIYKTISKLILFEIT